MPLVIRIGIHIGDVVFKDGDVFGDGVNIAARIEPLAEPGGIAISQTVYDMIKARPEIQTVSLGQRELKNIKDAVNIYKVLIDANGAAAPAFDWAPPAKALLAAAVIAVGAIVYVRRGAPRTVLLPAPVPAPAPAEDAALKRERNDAFWAMRVQLVSKTVPGDEKARMAQAYYDRYHERPGIHPGNAAELSQYLPAGPAKDEMAALGASPRGKEAVAQMKLKFAASSQVADAEKLPPGPERRDFVKRCPLSATSWFVDIKEGEPARDERGRLSFKYKLASGEEHVVPVSADVLKDGPDGEAAVARAAADVASDFLQRR